MGGWLGARVVSMNGRQAGDHWGKPRLHSIGPRWTGASWDSQESSACQDCTWGVVRSWVRWVLNISGLSVHSLVESGWVGVASFPWSEVSNRFSSLASS